MREETGKLPPKHVTEVSIPELDDRKLVLRLKLTHQVDEAPLTLVYDRSRVGDVSYERQVPFVCRVQAEDEEWLPVSHGLLELGTPGDSAVRLDDNEHE